MRRAMTSLFVEDIEETAAFYEALLGFTRHYTSDWFVILIHEDAPGWEFGLLKAGHEIIPKNDRKSPAGVLMTFVVDDLPAYEQKAEVLGAVIVERPTDLFYGQRRLLLRDPAGTLVDLSEPVAGTV